MPKKGYDKSNDAGSLESGGCNAHLVRSEALSRSAGNPLAHPQDGQQENLSIRSLGTVPVSEARTMDSKENVGRNDVVKSLNLELGAVPPRLGQTIRINGLTYLPKQQVFRKMLNGKQFYSAKHPEPSKKAAAKALQEIEAKMQEFQSSQVRVSQVPPPVQSQTPLQQATAAVITLRDAARLFLENEKLRFQTKEITLSTLGSTQYLMGRLLDEIKIQFVHEITASTLDAYAKSIREYQLIDHYSHATIKHHFRLAKAFIMWCYEMEYLQALPRNFKSVFKLSKDKNRKPPDVYTFDQLRTLLQVASDRTKLYILLMLNCGFYPVDISSLTPAEYHDGKIRRHRNKTGVEGEWVLWQETQRLLEQEKERIGDFLLLNEDGLTLQEKKFSQNGHVIERNSLIYAFKRLFKKTSIKGTIKRFRKTGANLVEDVSDKDTAKTFLAHAAETVADKHYLQRKFEKLGQALRKVEGNLIAAKILPDAKQSVSNQNAA